MATVIDSLLIELGLDASKFDNAQVKSIAQLRKFDETSKKAVKATQDGTKAMSNGFDKAKNALMAFGTAVIGIKGFQEFVVSATKGNAALGRTAQLLNMGVRDLDAWGAAVETVGGTADGFHQSMQNIVGGLSKFKQGLGGEEVVSALARLGVQSKDGSVDLDDLSDALIRVKKQYGIQTALSMAQQLGLDQGTFQLLMQGRDAIDQIVAKQREAAASSEETSAAAQQLQQSWANLMQGAKGLRDQLYSELAPTLSWIVDLLGDVIKKTDDIKGIGDIKAGNWFKASTDLDAGTFLKAVGMKAMGVSDKNIAKMLGDSAGAKATPAPAHQATGSSVGGDAAGSNASQRKRVIDYMMSQGWTKEQAAGIAANIETESGYRANAVGDKGAAYGIGQWHKDRQDKFAQVFGKDMKSSTLDEQLSFYNWELKNSESGAGNALKGATTAGDAAKIVSSKFERPADTNGEMMRRAQLASGMVGAKAGVPGVPGGGSSVQTHIQTVNVNTQATDANGIARDMHVALAQNALINSGMTAAQ